ANIGLIYKDLTQYQLALEYLIRAHEMYQCLLPEEHPYIASVLSGIGSVYEDQRDYKRAYDYYKCSFKMEHKILPRDHPQLKKLQLFINQVYRKKVKKMRLLSEEQPAFLTSEENSFYVEELILPTFK
ncbi:unnamed protein product, partial [Didymodactylos carnosus]